MNYQEQYYEVHPSQLSWAMHELSQRPDYQVIGYGKRGSMMLITVLAPVGAAQGDWRGAGGRSSFRPLFAFNWRVFVQSLCVLAIVGGLGYMAWSIFGGEQPTLAGVPVEVGGMKLAPDGRMVQPSPLEQAQGVLADARNWLRGLLPRQQPPAPQQKVPAPWWRFWNQKPDIAGPNAAATEWSWPPKNPVGDAIDGVGQAVTWLVYAAIFVGVLLVVKFIMDLAARFGR